MSPIVARRLILASVLGALLLASPLMAVVCSSPTSVGTTGLANPILFVTQFPVAADFLTIGSTFGNHLSDVGSVGRGGDLYILYPDGDLCNITREAGFGEAATFQGASSIAVRDPDVHWDADRALFSMVVGATDTCFERTTETWQIYEVTGLGQGAAMTVELLANQPTAFNNVSPIYSPDGRVVFTSDRPRDGRAHLYPQHDEYESSPTNTGLWALDVQTGELEILDHSPSGNFTPLADSFGRLVFTRWDHLQTDQQVGSDGIDTFDWASEEPDAAISAAVDVFPELREGDPNDHINDHRFNHFFPWQIHPDGRELETLNHIGRHELHSYFDRNRTDDDSLEEFSVPEIGRLEHFFHIAEDPTEPGTYFGTDAPEFGTHSSGQLLKINGAPSVNPESMSVTEVTHGDTRNPIGDADPLPPEGSGHYRDPLPLADGALLAVHTAEMRNAEDEGDLLDPGSDANCTDNPFVTAPRYDLRVRRMVDNPPDHLEAGTELTGVAGIQRTIEFLSPDIKIRYDGPMWELSPVEVRTRALPPALTAPLPAPESQIFAEEGIDPADFVAFLEANDLALAVSRNVTTRDSADLQQPYNLEIAGGGASTVANKDGPAYQLQYMQFFQGDQVRGIADSGDPPDPGRRVLAREMHDVTDNPPSTGPEGSVDLAADGSMAALVPAHRAMSWQLTDGAGEAVVRERYWVTFAPGEIRVCASCHGLNTVDQVGAVKPTNPPEALRSLLRHWLATDGLIFSDGFESGATSTWSTTTP